jgi:hypothetical protein
VNLAVAASALPHRTPSEFAARAHPRSRQTASPAFALPVSARTPFSRRPVPRGSMPPVMGIRGGVRPSVPVALWLPVSVRPEGQDGGALHGPRIGGSSCPAFLGTRSLSPR